MEIRTQYIKFRENLQQNGHGYVVPRLDATKVMCTGPGRCSVCDTEKADLKRLQGLLVDSANPVPGQTPNQLPPDVQYANYVSYLQKEGHGHVLPRIDGTRTRCGGPSLCHRCQSEKENLQRYDEKRKQANPILQPQKEYDAYVEFVTTLNAPSEPDKVAAPVKPRHNPIKALDDYTEYLYQHGHGHIYPRADGSKNLCTGDFCTVCQTESWRLKQHQEAILNGFREFLLSRPDLECFNLEPNKWRSSLLTVDGPLEAFGSTRYQAQGDLFALWHQKGAPAPSADFASDPTF